MKLSKFLNLFYVLLLVAVLSMGTSVYSQTVVQWYTSMGDFRAQLREDLVPMTAQNFINLTDTNFYDDLIFHRVISGFMIQDGCPYGTGYGGPGYTFDDEFHPDLRHDEPGILSMANSGPNTNGSQYFITVAQTSWLDDLHAVFGKIIDGMEVVYAISEVPTDANDKPLIDVEIDSIRVVTGDPGISLTAPGTKWNGSVDNEITWDSEFIADVNIEFSSDNGTSWSDIVESTSANTRSYTWPATNITSTECLIKISDVSNPDVFDISEVPFTLCHLDLLNPNDFELYRVGTQVEISWSSDMVGDLTLSYKTSATGDWMIIEEGVAVGSNSYSWTVEEATNWCKVRLTETAFPEVYDESENIFIVFRLDLTSPVGGENLSGNSQFDITWDSEIITTVKIEFSSDNGEDWSTVSNSVPAGNSTYDWTVPNINSDECFIKLTTSGLPDLFATNLTPFSISEFSGISNQSVNKNIRFSLSPCPAEDEVTITLSNPNEWEGNLFVEIFNMKGELVLSQHVGVFKNEAQPIKLDLSDLHQGIYVIKVATDNKYTSQKFIKK